MSPDAAPLGWVAQILGASPSPIVWGVLIAVVVVALAYSPLAKAFANWIAKRKED